MARGDEAIQGDGWRWIERSFGADFETRTNTLD